MGTPAAEGDHAMTGKSVEFDQRYIDMMMPHHASIIALAQAARVQLTDERLQSIAENIISSQTAENEELRGYREQWYGSPEAMPMDETMMGMVMEMIPGMGDVGSMQMMMDPHALMANFCSAEEPDLAFIDLTIPHHQMAIMASEAALEQATHDEIRAIAERVIQDQQREIDELTAIRGELAGEGTPTTMNRYVGEERAGRIHAPLSLRGAGTATVSHQWRVFDRRGLRRVRSSVRPLAHPEREAVICGKTMTVKSTPFRVPTTPYENS